LYSHQLYFQPGTALPLFCKSNFLLFPKEYKYLGFYYFI